MRAESWRRVSGSRGKFRVSSFQFKAKHAADSKDSRGVLSFRFFQFRGAPSPLVSLGRENSSQFPVLSSQKSSRRVQKSFTPPPPNLAWARKGITPLQSNITDPARNRFC